ncbi:MAG: BamA/TamA family outer membrane protein [Bacteroidales bacterium]|nr:BamA/TamA family outer membrane protein [Bacteroidales bacterium]
MKRRARIAILIASAALLCACSTTRVLKPGQYRLERNIIRIRDSKSGVSSSDVSSYVRQQANSYVLFGWNPSLVLYNWSNPDKDDWFNNALRSAGTAPVVFNGNQVASSRENIAKHLDYLGYYHSKVESRVDTIGRTVRVYYFVEPGKRYQIDSIVYSVPGGEFEKEFRQDLRNTLVKPGDYLSEKLLESETTRGASWFRDRGYYDFTKYNYAFEADTLGPRNILTYRIREYSRNELAIAAKPLEKYHIGKVTIEHSAEVPFRENVLRDINTIHPGDLYSERLINRSYNRLTALRVFNNVGIEMIPADTATVDCRITLGESKLQGVKVNLEASTNSTGLLGVSPNVSFYHKNIFHGGEWFSLGFSGNFQGQPGTTTRATEFGVNTSLSFPRLLGLPYSVFKGNNIPRTELVTSFNYQKRPEFQRWIGNFSFGYTGNSRRFYYQVYPLRATVIKVGEMSDDFLMSLLRNISLYDGFYDHIDVGLSGQVYWATTTDLVPKGSYTTTRLTLDSSGNIISLFRNYLPVNEFGERMLFGLGYAQYVRVGLQVAHAFSLGEKTSLALRFDGGVGTPYGSSASMPFEKMFFVGGASSMRGWQTRALGPGSSPLMTFFTIPSQTGDFKAELDLELRQKLFWKIEGALFAEAGNVWDFMDLPSNFIETIGADWGLGVRLNLGFILLRLDWGYKLYEPSREAGSRFLTPLDWLFDNDSHAVHFGVGYPF